MEIKFCKNKCCPTVTLRPNGSIVLGDSQGPEGITVWTKQNFADFLEAAKAGKFDHLVAEPEERKRVSLADLPEISMRPAVQCPCGKTQAHKCDCDRNGMYKNKMGKMDIYENGEMIGSQG